MTTEVNNGRRGFIKSLAALAALAVAPDVLSKLPAPAATDIWAEMKTGLVYGKTFILDRPIVIDFADKLVISHCKFVAKFSDSSLPFITFGSGATNCVVTCCSFIGNGSGWAGPAEAESPIQIELKLPIQI